MSIVLDQDTRPKGVEVKTSMDGKRVWVGTSSLNWVGDADIDMSLDDFCAVVEYVLTNTDLLPCDPRADLLRRLKNFHPVPGYNNGNKRLAYCP